MKSLLAFGAKRDDVSKWSLRPRQGGRMTFESVDKLWQDAVQCHFNATPIGNRRRTKRVILVFFKSLIQRASENLNQSEFLVPIEFRQTVHLGVRLINSHTTACIG